MNAKDDNKVGLTESFSPSIKPCGNVLFLKIELGQ
jgi:hypothetical protein